MPTTAGWRSRPGCRESRPGGPEDVAIEVMRVENVHVPPLQEGGQSQPLAHGVQAVKVLDRKGYHRNPGSLVARHERPGFLEADDAKVKARAIQPFGSADRI